MSLDDDDRASQFMSSGKKRKAGQNHVLDEMIAEGPVEINSILDEREANVLPCLKSLQSENFSKKENTSAEPEYFPATYTTYARLSKEYLYTLLPVWEPDQFSESQLREVEKNCPGSVHKLFGMGLNLLFSTKLFEHGHHRRIFRRTTIIVYYRLGQRLSGIIVERVGGKLMVNWHRSVLPYALLPEDEFPKIAVKAMLLPDGDSHEAPLTGVEVLDVPELVLDAHCEQQARVKSGRHYSPLISFFPEVLVNTFGYHSVPEMLTTVGAEQYFLMQSELENATSPAAAAAASFLTASALVAASSLAPASQASAPAPPSEASAPTPPSSAFDCL
mmetsp:Transcript_64450/g.167491  ORF Transcript_64450/g.167491 Transcript_64450/m.167491 type:complete len:332 (+) Transcript_64450:93-1088(+)